MDIIRVVLIILDEDPEAHKSEMMVYPKPMPELQILSETVPFNPHPKPMSLPIISADDKEGLHSGCSGFPVSRTHEIYVYALNATCLSSTQLAASHFDPLLVQFDENHPMPPLMHNRVHRFQNIQKKAPHCSEPYLQLYKQTEPV